MTDTIVVSETYISDVIASESTSSVIVSIAEQGPPGPPGDTTILVVADEAIGGHRVVKATTTGCAYADSSNVSDAGKVLGLTTSATSPGNPTVIHRSGDIIESSWNWNLGPVYLGTIGTLTQTPPTQGFIQQIGIAISATRLLVNIQQPIEVL